MEQAELIYNATHINDLADLVSEETLTALHDAGVPNILSCVEELIAVANLVSEEDAYTLREKAKLNRIRFEGEERKAWDRAKALQKKEEKESKKQHNDRVKSMFDSLQFAIESKTRPVFQALSTRFGIFDIFFAFGKVYVDRSKKAQEPTQEEAQQLVEENCRQQFNSNLAMFAERAFKAHLCAKAGGIVPSPKAIREFYGESYVDWLNNFEAKVEEELELDDIADLQSPEVYVDTFARLIEEVYTEMTAGLPAEAVQISPRFTRRRPARR